MLCPVWVLKLSTPRFFLTHLYSVKAFACAGAASAGVWCIRSALGTPGATWMQMAVAFWWALVGLVQDLPMGFNLLMEHFKTGFD